MAGLVFNKFVSGIPLYRQEQELKRKKIEITRSNMSNWLIMSGKHEDIQAVIYDYHPNREHIHAQKILGNNFSGYVHSDGYEAYHRLDNVVSVGCMAHLRRKFVEALEVSPIRKELKKLSKAKQVELIDVNPSYKNILHIVYLIKKLFTHEHEYMKKKYSVEEIQVNREDQVILDELLKCIKQHKHEYHQKVKWELQ